MNEIESTSAYSNEGVAAKHPFGVLYHGDYQNPHDGMSIAIRAHARALAATGLPVALRPISSKVVSKQGILEPLHVAGLDPAVDVEVHDLTRADIGTTYPTIKHLIPHSLQQISGVIMKGAIGPLDKTEVIMAARKAVYDSTILFSVWERDRISPELARELSRVRENWVPCEQNAQMLREHGVTNVQVLPHPFDPTDSLVLLRKRSAIEGRRFYSIGKWEPRKNYPALIEGFLLAFNPDDDVHLTIKTSGQWTGFESPEECLARVAALPSVASGWSAEQIAAKVQVITKRLKRSNILRLHFENNIYVSPSCGEGFGVPAFESKVAGNRMVYVAWGGPSDFASPEDCRIRYSMEAVPAEYGWGKCMWAKASALGISLALQEALPPKSFDVPESFDAQFSADAVGARMKARVLELSSGTRAGAYYQGLP